MSIKIENTQVFGWEAAIRGARNPMNSWEKSDSHFICPDEDTERWCGDPEIGPNDHKLLMNLCKGGTDEAKWRRMVHVQMDVTAPLYWWKEFETYKVGTVSNSCSTMHKIHTKEFTMDDFSCEHLSDALCMNPDLDEDGGFRSKDNYFCFHGGVEDFKASPSDILWIIVQALNLNRELFLKTKDKRYWWQMIQLLPSSYNQKRTIDLNYEVLAAQYRQRKEHKLQEWLDYCAFIKSLPYCEFITMEN